MLLRRTVQRPALAGVFHGCCASRSSPSPSPAVAQLEQHGPLSSWEASDGLETYHTGSIWSSSLHKENALNGGEELHALHHMGANHFGKKFSSCTCGLHGSTEFSGHAVRGGHGILPSNSAGSLILSNSYASSSRFEDKAKIRALMESRGLKKEPGWSRIEIQGQLNTFLVDDKNHPRNVEIRAELRRLLEEMKDAGYVADIRCVLRDIPDRDKENALMHHSERLAMALGHISLPPKAPLRVIKNLRVCNDCHVATKYFAKLYQREIIVRDATRFHHFKAEGYCSCGDYW